MRSRKVSRILAGLGVAVFVSVAILAGFNFVSAAWSEPTAYPPNDNIAAPVNTGSVNQTKTGGLIMGQATTTGSLHVNNKLCFYTGSAYDCKDSWAAVGGLWTASGNNIYNANTGNVGIGTASPAAKLDISVPSSNQTSYILYSNNYNNLGIRTGSNAVSGIAGYQYNNNTAVGGYYGLLASVNAFYDGTNWYTKNGWIGPTGILITPMAINFFTNPQQGGTPGTFTPDNKMTIQNNGSVGIGAQSATWAKLQVAMGTGATTGGLYISRSGASSWSYLTIENQSAGPVFKVDENGNTGIGTANTENYKLKVAGTTFLNGKVLIGGLNYGTLADFSLGQECKPLKMSFQENGSDFHGIGLGCSSSWTANELRIMGGMDSPITFGYVTNPEINFVEVFRINTSNGNVGIGTKTPTEPLSVNTGRIYLGQTTAPAAVADKLYNIGGNLFWNGTQLSGGGSSAGGWTDGGATVRLTTASDNVGLGATTAAAPLHISRAPVGGNPWIAQLYIEPGTNNSDAGLSLRTTETASDRVWTILAGSGVGNTNFRIYDSTAGADRLNIDSSGNVGIGTTVPSTKLHLADSVAGLLSIQVSNSDTSASSRSAIRFTAGDANNFIIGKNSPNYSANPSYGLVWNNGAGGIYFGVNNTEAMRLATDGRLGLGKSSPGYKLDIEDNSGSGGTAIMRIDQNNATKLYTGLRLDRQTTEKWFIGMNDADDKLIFRQGGTNWLTLTTASAAINGGLSLNNNLTVDGSEVIADGGYLRTNRLAAGDFNGTTQGLLNLAAFNGYSCQTVCGNHNLTCKYAANLGGHQLCAYFDVNKDSKINGPAEGGSCVSSSDLATDYCIVSNCALGTCGSCQRSCDLNGDGSVNAQDTALVTGAVNQSTRAVYCSGGYEEPCDSSIGRRSCVCGQ